MSAHPPLYSVKEEVTIESGSYNGAMVGATVTVTELKASAGRGWLYTVTTKQGATVKNIVEEDLFPSADETNGG